MVVCYRAIDNQTCTSEASLKSVCIGKLFALSHSASFLLPELEVEITSLPAESHRSHSTSGMQRSVFSWPPEEHCGNSTCLMDSQPFQMKLRLQEKLLSTMGQNHSGYTTSPTPPPTRRSNALPIERKPLPWEKIIAFDLQSPKLWFTW